MSARNNEERIGARNIDTSTTPAALAENPLHFVTPTEFIELPSKGIGYPEGHVLYEKDVIEIRFMTAKDEDILSSKTLLKKGIAIERFLQNIIVDSNIKVHELLIGDKNAIIVGARASGYGNIYQTKIRCPNCGETSKFDFDLNGAKTYFPPDNLDAYSIQKTTQGTFTVKTPVSGFSVEVRLMTGKDEVELAFINEKKKKLNISTDSSVTDQYKKFIVSVNGYKERDVINYYIDNMPAADSRSLRLAYKKITPNIELKGDFECPSCGHIQELEVPLGADFFWPDR